MKLRDIHFPPVMNASGARGFFGEGYPYHRWWKYLGLTYKHCGFVAKTTTLHPRAGNMLMKSDRITPARFKPDCIKVYPWQGAALNAVGLTGPGAEWLLSQYRWQTMLQPFFISFMATAATAEERLAELQHFIEMLQRFSPQDWNGKFGLELNFSCPNTQLHPQALVDEIYQALTQVNQLAVPVQVKINPLVPARSMVDIADHSGCDAIVMGNTIPWSQLVARIDWHGFSKGRQKSPLHKYGGGGLSGAPLLEIVRDWIYVARQIGITKPIWACGGIMRARDVRRVWLAGANGIQIGSVAMLRPWRMRSIINEAYTCFGSYFVPAKSPEPEKSRLFVLKYGGAV